MSEDDGLLAQYGFVVAAYVLTWIVVVGYAFYVNARARRAFGELTKLSGTEVER
jgi:CcmD family protein